MKFIEIDLAKNSFLAIFPQNVGYFIVIYKNDKKSIEIFLNKLDREEHHSIL